MKKRKLFNLFCVSAVGGVLAFSAGNKLSEHMIDKRAEAKEEAFLEEYSDLLIPMNKSYDSYIEAIGEGIKMADMTHNVMEIFSAYLTMQNNGYLSQGKSFHSEQPYFEYDDNLGISIPLGVGVCRNQSENLYLVLKNMGYKCGFVAGDLYNEKNKERSSNHAVVWIEEDGVFYLLDPINKTVFVKDIFGIYRSITDENLKFNVIMKDNKRLGLHEENKPLYYNSSDDYTNVLEHLYHFENALKHANECVDFFEIFEAEYLQAYEDAIMENVVEYFARETKKGKTL